jgi:hypothetical protein
MAATLPRLGAGGSAHDPEQCRHRGIEAIVLQPGDDLVDLVDLAERAVDRGAAARAAR